MVEFGWDDMNPAVENKSHFSIPMDPGSTWPLSSPALLYHTSNIADLKHIMCRQSLKYSHTVYSLIAEYLMNIHLLPSPVPEAADPSFNNIDVPPWSRGGTETLTGNNNAAE